MTTGLTVTVVGADRLARTSRAAARKIEKLEAANRRSGNAIRGAASPPRRTGALASSLTVAADDREATVSSGLVYAPVIENGWRAHNIAPTHFLERALETGTAPTLVAYGEHTKDTIRTIRGA